VCGELASTGIMGANRLASNSLSECLVFGYRAVEHAAAKFGEESSDSHITCNPGEQLCTIDPNLARFYDSIKRSVAEIMVEHAGIVRTKSQLEEGIEKLNQLNEKILSLNSTTDYYVITARFLITTATLIIKAALAREESRGGHYRSDYPQEDSQMIKHSIQQKDKQLIFTI
jgi:L-aspartate oxidase